MSKIAPCPACGGKADMWGSEPGAWVGCENERCALCGPIEDSVQQAIAAWNRLSAAAELAKLARAKLAGMDKNAGFELPGKFQVTITVDAGLIRATGGGE